MPSALYVNASAYMMLLSEQHALHNKQSSKLLSLVTISMYDKKYSASILVHARVIAHTFQALMKLFNQMLFILQSLIAR